MLTCARYVTLIQALPQLITAVPSCDGCDATWSFHNNMGGTVDAEVLITEAGAPPAAGPGGAASTSAGSDGAACKLDSATWHSRAGTSEYCADPSAVSKVSSHAGAPCPECPSRRRGRRAVGRT